jgi:hypothetical protein
MAFKLIVVYYLQQLLAPHEVMESPCVWPERVLNMAYLVACRETVQRLTTFLLEKEGRACDLLQ